MDIVDLPDPSRVARKPDRTRVLFGGRLGHGGIVVLRAELRLYVERKDARGEYSLVTSYVEAECGSVEMAYEEGYLGADPLGSAAGLLLGTLGLAGLATRSAIALRGG